MLRSLVGSEMCIRDRCMAFTLRQLQFFVAAAETGSVSGAARALSISQSSVTEAIQSLEADDRAWIRATGRR